MLCCVVLCCVQFRCVVLCCFVLCCVFSRFGFLFCSVFSLLFNSVKVQLCSSHFWIKNNYIFLFRLWNLLILLNHLIKTILYLDKDPSNVITNLRMVVEV